MTNIKNFPFNQIIKNLINYYKIIFVLLLKQVVGEDSIKDNNKFYKINNKNYKIIYNNNFLVLYTLI